MNNYNAIYAQSGGVTAVINATACGVIETFLKTNQGKIYGGINGILGILQEELIDLTLEPTSNIQGLKYTPAGALGSCRYKLKNIDTDPKEYYRLIEVFKAHNIKYFFYNGGGDSQDTAYKISQLGNKLGYPIQCIGIPKTIDNDLAFTDNCPGFGSVAKYIAISTLETSLDLISMSKNSTKVFILEVMGRNAGWIAASSGLAKKNLGDPPHIILFPEIPFEPDLFYHKVQATVEQSGSCYIVASEGIKDLNHQPINTTNRSQTKDQFGHNQLGGIAGFLAEQIQSKLKLKTHWALADYMQRSARHIAAAIDVEQAYALGKAAVNIAISGQNAVMPIIVRLQNHPYKWEIQSINLSEVANIEKKLPREFITVDGFNITPECVEYLLPLIQGEDYPTYTNGLPEYIKLQQHFVTKKLPDFIA